MVKSAMPTTFHSAVVLAGSLTDEMVRNGSLANPSAGNKRQWTGNTTRRFEGNPNKRNNRGAIKSYAGVTKEEGKSYQGTKPWCNKCRKHHLGDFCLEIVCFKCKKTGHLSRE